MLMNFEEFVERIRSRLQKRKFSREKIAFHIERLRDRYKDSPIFEEINLGDEVDDYFEDFEDGIKHLPVVHEVEAVNLSFVILKQTYDETVEKRIYQLRDHYEDLQEESGEILFPDDEEILFDPINVPGIFGRTPLIQAVFDGDLDRVNELLDLGADIGAKDNSGNDALQIAIFCGYDEIADRIREELKKNLLDFIV